MNSLIVQDTKDGVILTVHVQPKASTTECVGIHGDALKIRVAAPPVDGAANDELIRFVARQLSIPSSFGANSLRCERTAQTCPRQRSHSAAGDGSFEPWASKGIGEAMRHRVLFIVWGWLIAHRLFIGASCSVSQCTYAICGERSRGTGYCGLSAISRNGWGGGGQWEGRSCGDRHRSGSRSRRGERRGRRSHRRRGRQSVP